MRYGVTARRKRNVRRMGELANMRQERRDHRRAAGSVKLTVSEADMSGKLVIEAMGINKSFGERRHRRGLLDPHPARRPRRPDRTQRSGQDDAAEDADRRARARQRARCASARTCRW